jgi:hypothetical protein
MATTQRDTPLRLTPVGGGVLLEVLRARRIFVMRVTQNVPLARLPPSSSDRERLRA